MHIKGCSHDKRLSHAERIENFSQWLHKHLHIAHVGDNTFLKDSIPKWGVYVPPKPKEKEEKSSSDSESDEESGVRS
jgi:hypothetical protein